MRFKIQDLREVKISEDKNYLIKRWEYYDTITDAIRDMYRIYALMKYNIENNEEFRDISFLIVVSSTKGKGKICPRREKIQTKGRPKLQVNGVKTQPHIHIACFGRNCPTFVKKITDKLNKKAFSSYEDFSKRKFKGRRLFTYDKLKGPNKGADYIPYLYNQADKILTYGKINFNKMYDPMFIVID